MGGRLMRMANVQDTWRDALKHKKGKFTLDKLVVKNIKGIGDQEIPFLTKLTTLCGENGAGKTTVLKALFCAITPKKSAAMGISLKPQTNANEPTAICTITARVLPPAGSAEPAKMVVISDKDEIAKYFGDETDECLAAYFDAAATAQRIIHLINSDSDFSTALEGVAFGEDSNETLELRREITGRTYSKVVTYEIEDYNDLPVFPYFKVTVGNSAYSSEEMGLGELCANYLIWALGRLKNESLLLLEEPESHLPPRAQESLMAYVAKLCVDRNLTVVVSTHSQHTLANVPMTHITFMARRVDKCVVQREPQVSTLYESLHIANPSLCVMIVEDHSAFAFVETVISKLEPALLPRFDFTWGGGWSDIDEILLKVPRRGSGRVKLLGVYDGDQRQAARKKFDWPFIFLPGEKDPAEYMAVAVRNNCEDFARLLNYSVVGMEIAVGNLDGVDYKDFFPALQRSLNRSVQELYRSATEIWLRSEENLKASRELIKEIRKNAF